MCTCRTQTPDRIDDFADLRRPDTGALRLAAAALLVGILMASTTLYLKAMDGAASILLH